MTTIYEFVVETLDYYEGCGDDPDIIDTTPFSTLIAAQRFARQCEAPWRIALRRDTGNECEGLTVRYYAYPNATGRLPPRMESAMNEQDGPTIPAKYRSLIFPVNKSKE